MARNHESERSDKPDPALKKVPDSPAAGTTPEVQTSGWVENQPRAKWKAFPGPRVPDESLRIAMSRVAYADMVSHAKESLDAEVCGVLIGDFCEDDDGPFVSITATIRGTAAREGSAHVTFTQETWNRIHEVKEEKHRKAQIVGWYHSHPGFGVEFSEMDLFVQRNFFPGASQIAYVIDPLGGAEAICANLPDGIRPVSRFWIEGRERRCQPKEVELPRSSGGQPDAQAVATLQAVESRLTQLIQVVDEQRQTMHRFLFGMGTFLATAIVVTIGYGMYRMYTHDLTPPQLQSYLPVPVRIGDHNALLGLQVVDWRLPPELDAVVQAQAKLRLEEEKAAAAKARQAAETQSAPPAAP